MITQGYDRILKYSLGVLLGIIMILPLHPFVSTWGGVIVGPLLVWKSWKELVLLAVFAVLVVWGARQGKLRSLFKDRVIQLVTVYTLFALMITFAMGYIQSTSVAGIGMGLRYLLIFAMMYGIAQYLVVSDRMRERLFKVIAVWGIVLALLGIIQVFMLPGDFLAHFGYVKDVTIAPTTTIDSNDAAKRAFATLRGPNDYGAYMILPLIIALSGMLSRNLGVVVALLSSFAIVLSGSRSAWLGAAVALTTYIVMTRGINIVRHRYFKPALVAAVIVMTGFAYASVNFAPLRLAVFHSSPGDSHLFEGSNDAHIQSTTNGIRRVMANPLGCGLGCAGPASYYGNEPRISENYYVQIAEEVGVVGLSIWLAIFVVIMRRLWRVRHEYAAQILFASGAGFAIIGFLLHVWADDPLSLTWWGLAGLVSGTHAYQSRRSK